MSRTVGHPLPVYLPSVSTLRFTWGTLQEQVNTIPVRLFATICLTFSLGYLLGKRVNYPSPPLPDYVYPWTPKEPH